MSDAHLHADPALRELLSAPEWDTVRYGLELASALGEEYLASLTGSLAICTDGTISWPDDWEKTTGINPDFLENAALFLLALGHSPPLASVTALDLSHSAGLTDLTPLATCEKLERLILNDCTALTSLAPLGELASLRHLVAENCASSLELPNFSIGTNLQFLSVSDYQLSDLEPLGNASCLKKLYLGWASNLDDISALGGCKNLEQLRFGYTSFSDFSALTSSKSLRKLSFIGSDFPASTDSIGTISSLEELLVDGPCPFNLAPVAKLPNLRVLRLPGCIVENPHNLLELDKLEVLELPETIILDDHLDRYSSTQFRRHLQLFSGLSRSVRYFEGSSVARIRMATALIYAFGSTLLEWRVVYPLVKKVCTVAPPEILGRLKLGLLSKTLGSGDLVEDDFGEDSPIRQFLDSRKTCVDWTSSLAKYLRKLPVKASSGVN